jgi:hypothetical protein
MPYISLSKEALQRNLEKLGASRADITFKFNVLRTSSHKSEPGLQMFNRLENRFSNVCESITNLEEAGEKRKDPDVVFLNVDDDEVEGEIRRNLEKSAGLLSSLHGLLDDIERYKFRAQKWERDERKLEKSMVERLRVLPPGVSLPDHYLW